MPITAVSTPVTPAAPTCASLTANDFIGMACVPASTAGLVRSGPTHTVASISAFAMAKFETTYTDWNTVRTWALSNGYTFANAGQIGSSGAGSPAQPASNMNWRDMIIWSNAASQKNGLTPVYYTDAAFTNPVKIATNTACCLTTPGAEDNPYVKWSANGYRLPTGAEWEYAARYVNSATNMRDDAPSGWTDSNSNTLVDSTEFDPVAWTTNNAAGTTQPVGTLAPNALGIYDLCGNIYELVWDWNGAYANASPYTDADSTGPASGTARDVRGGAYGVATTFAIANWRGTTTPQSPNNQRGFRVVRRPL